MLKNKKFVSLMLTLGLVFIAISLFYIKDPKYHIIDGLLIGYGCGLFGSSLACFFNISFEEKNPDQAKAMAIEHADERNTMIRNRAKAKAADIIQLISLLLISLLSILFSQSAWIVIALALSFLAYHFLSLIYFNKYSKEM